MSNIRSILLMGVLSLSVLGPASEPGGRAVHGNPRHAEEGFGNPDAPPDRGFMDFLKWRWERLSKDIPGPDAYDFPLAENDPAFLKGNREKNTVTWIGHATVLVQMGGKNVLTDPNFSERASPVQWAGPRRVTPPGLSVEDLPLVDAVVVSHDHYDSLDRGSIEGLRAREGGEDTVFFVPLGLKGWFEDLGITKVVELDWWETREEDGLSVTAVPVRHWSKRGLLGRNRTLWAGWALKAKGFSFMFVGDSGYGGHFREIGRRLGPFDLAAIPIGAYEPRWFMKAHHVSPEEALKAHLDLRAKKSVALHWGTFVLTDEPLTEPPERLKRAMRKRGMPEGEFMVLKHGETVVLE